MFPPRLLSLSDKHLNLLRVLQGLTVLFFSGPESGPLDSDSFNPVH